MIRNIIRINADRCDGCGVCVKACHEGAIGLVDGKAKLLRDDYCDGLGDCLPACPRDAIRFEEREALPYDEDAVRQNRAKAQEPLACGCPGTESRLLELRPQVPLNASGSCLRQWPVQLRLAPVNASWLENADILLAACCSAYACGDFHARFMKDRITLIACPRLDEDQTAKLTELLRQNTVKSLTIARMEVPCCGGLERTAKQAIEASGKDIPYKVVILGTGGIVREKD